MNRPVRRTLLSLALASTVLAGTPAYAQAPMPTDPGSATTPVATPTAAPGDEATAEPAATPTPTPSVPANPYGDLGSAGLGTSGQLPALGAAQMEEMALRYSSLSGALVNYYAVTQGKTLDEFVKENPVGVANLLGTRDAGALVDGSVQTQDLKSLNASLAAQGALVSTKEYDSFEKYAEAISAKSGSVDAAVVVAGAGWAKQMASLRAPSLAAPAAPGVNKSLATQMPKEGLVFGMFLDKSLTAMVADFPQVFAQAQSTGLGTPAAKQAWNTSMMRAMQSSRADYSKMLPSSCGGALLSVMGSGDARAARTTDPKGSCTPCVTAGLYLNSQMQRLFDPTLGTTAPNRADNVMPPGEFNALQPWQQQLVLKQNPDLSKQLTQSVTGAGSSSGCSASKAATSGAVKTVLPGVLGNLSR